MKIETKRKLVKWFINLINYKETADPKPFIIREEHKIEIIRNQHIYTVEELNWIKRKSSYGYLAAHEIGKILLHIKAISFTEEPYQDVYAQEGVSKIKVTAELKIVLP